MKRADQVDNIIKDILFDFTHLWVDNFGWENIIFLASDFDKIVRFPIKEDDGSCVFFAYKFDDEKEEIEVRKFKGNYYGKNKNYEKFNRH